MSSPSIIARSSPLSDLETVDFSADDRFVDSLLQASMESLSPPPPAIKTTINSLQEFTVPSPGQVTKKPGSKSRPKSKINPAEELPRRRSTRVSTAPSRFQPEVRSHKPANIPESEPSDTTLENTPTVNSTVISIGDSPATPTPKAHAVSGVGLIEEISPFAGAEDIVDPPEPKMVEDNAEAVPFGSSRSRRPKQNIPMVESTDGSTVEASPAPPKRYNKKKKPAVRKLKTPVKKPTTPSEDNTPSPSSSTSTKTRKRPPGEEPAESSYKRVKSEHRTPLAVETSVRRTRSQNASVPVQPAGFSPAAETQPTRKPATKARRVKSPAAKATYTPPRLSAVHFLVPLRAMVKSAILHYSTLPTNLTDVDAIANLYRTFCALDTYQHHLKGLGLGGDDKDVRGIMKQVWRLVDLGERDEEVIWKTLLATWDSQGGNGWGNDGI